MRTLAFVLLFLSQFSMAFEGYYRSPALHQDTLVFTAEGDLWKIALSEPYAQRLTTQMAEESQASISPDGQSIAFVANYTGTPEVYVMPIQGGLAKRVSFENAGVKVHGWSPQQQVLYSYNGRVGPAGNWTLKLVDPESLMTQSLPLADAIEGTLADDGRTLYFTQFGLQASNDNARAYQGGAKGEIWSFDLKAKQEATQLTKTHQGSTRSPMPYQDRIYFVSNQSGNDNIWSMDLTGNDFTQHTQYQGWQVKDASMHGHQIVYQLGADIKVFDIKQGSSQVKAIKLTSDLAQRRPHWVNKPLDYLTSAKQAGGSKKVVLTARGRVAVASTDNSRLVEIATPADSRTRKALLSHDEQFVYALNDSSGELEIWQYMSDGSSKAQQLTFDGKGFRFDLHLSPDGKSIVHSDKKGRLWLLDIASQKNRLLLDDIAHGSYADEVSWSSNSQLLAINYYQKDAERGQILLIDLLNNKQQVLTSDRYASYSPAFSSDDKWLYFLSERNFTASVRSPWGDRNMGTAFDRKAQIFAIALSSDAQFAFADSTELDNQHQAEQAKDKKTKNADTYLAKEQSDTPLIKVDWQNINARLWQVPVKAGNYFNLLANDKFLYVLDKSNQPNSQSELKVVEIKADTKVGSFAKDIAKASLSNDGKTLFMQKTGKQKSMLLVAATGKFNQKADNIKVKTRDWALLIDPQQEWQQIFFDAWLMHRDSLFDVTMRGLDWQAVKQKYQPLLARLTDRHELNDIFKQMMGELNALHSQVYGGDLPKNPDRAKPATLGAEYQQTEQGVKIVKIYQTDPELISRRAPLAKPGVDAQTNDLITAINAKPVKVVADIVKALQNQAGKQVLVTLQRQGKTIQTVVVPGSTRDDYYQRYYDWTQQNLQKVQKISPEIGYLHIRAMGASDIENFARDFYAQYQKQGLIIDVRRNNGGNIDSWIIEKLLRKAWSFWHNPGRKAYTNMQQTFRGHLVVLADQYTYSDGETFTAGIKALNLGTVIGKQTAGAGVWLSGRNRQSDNGIARVAEFPVFAIDGRWLTEGRGISPDVEVDNLPYATYLGQDAQLQAAIRHLQQQIKQSPVTPLKPKPLPKVEQAAEDIR